MIGHHIFAVNDTSSIRIPHRSITTKKCSAHWINITAMRVILRLKFALHLSLPVADHLCQIVPAAQNWCRDWQRRAHILILFKGCSRLARLLIILTMINGPWSLVQDWEQKSTKFLSLASMCMRVFRAFTKSFSFLSRSFEPDWKPTSIILLMLLDNDMSVFWPAEHDSRFGALQYHLVHVRECWA